MSEWYEHRFTFEGCHVVATIGARAKMSGRLNRSGFLPDETGMRIFRETETGWVLEKPFVSCTLVWDERKFSAINFCDVRLGDYAVVGAAKFRILAKQDYSVTLEDFDGEDMEVPGECISDYLAETTILPQATGWYTDRDNHVLYLSESGNWYTFSQEGKPEFDKVDESDLPGFINIHNLEMPEWNENELDN